MTASPELAIMIFGAGLVVGWYLATYLEWK